MHNDKLIFCPLIVFLDGNKFNYHIRATDLSYTDNRFIVHGRQTYRTRTIDLSYTDNRPIIIEFYILNFKQFISGL